MLFMETIKKRRNAYAAFFSIAVFLTAIFAVKRMFIPAFITGAAGIVLLLFLVRQCRLLYDAGLIRDNCILAVPSAIIYLPQGHSRLFQPAARLRKCEEDHTGNPFLSSKDTGGDEKRSEKKYGGSRGGGSTVKDGSSDKRLFIGGNSVKYKAEETLVSTFGLLIGDKIYKWGRDGIHGTQLTDIIIDRTKIYLTFGDDSGTMQIELLHGMACKQEVLDVLLKMWHETGLAATLYDW